MKPKRKAWWKAKHDSIQVFLNFFPWFWKLEIKFIYRLQFIFRNRLLNGIFVTLITLKRMKIIPTYCVEAKYLISEKKRKKKATQKINTMHLKVQFKMIKIDLCDRISSIFFLSKLHAWYEGTCHHLTLKDYYISFLSLFKKLNKQ